MGACIEDHLVSFANSLIDHVVFLLEADEFISQIKKLTPVTFPLGHEDRRAKLHQNNSVKL